MAYLEPEAQPAIDESGIFPSEPMAWARANERRSSRLLLSVRIVVSGTNPENGKDFEVAGKTLVVNKHGALIQTMGGLKRGMAILVTVPSRDQSAWAHIVWANPADEGKYGIEFETSQNVWGVHFPPDSGVYFAPESADPIPPSATPSTTERPC
jgi:hypothetical protein